jgi:septal ring factor EnvC (AmiA/AmiB activator)
MSLEDQLGSVANRIRMIEAVVVAIEKDLEVEKSKLTQAIADLKSLNEQMRPRND